MQRTPKHCNPILAAAMLAAFSSQPAWAESPAEVTLPQVEVVSTSPLPGIGIEKYKLPYEVQSVNEEAIYNSQSLNISEFMSRNLSGVNVNEVQGSPFQADITYRGFRASGILGSSQGLSIYMDGVRVNEPFGDVVNWDMLPEAAFGNVTLVPGSNPIYGLNTLGGALAFTTKSGLTTQGGEVKLQAGSFGRKRADLSYGNKDKDGWHQFISTTVFDEDGWRDYSSGQLGNVFAKIGRSQGDVNWDLSLLAAQSTLRGNGLLPSYSYGAEGSEPASAHMYEQNRRAIYTHTDRTQNQLNMLIFNFQRMFDSTTELASTTYLRQGKRNSVSGDVEFDNATPINITGVLNYSSTSQTSYGTSLNLTSVMDKHQLTAGASFDASTMRYGGSHKDDCAIDDSRGIIDPCGPELSTAGVEGKSYALGLYATDTWTVATDTFVTGAARFNHANVGNTITQFDNAGAGTVQPKESFNYNSFNPSLGISQKLSNELTVFGNVGQSNRVPTVIELGCADSANPCQLPIGLQADPYLKQVISRTIDTGLRWTINKDTGFSASLYRTENKNDILFSPVIDRQGFGFFSNFSQTRRQGMDLSAYTNAGPFALRASYNYLEATYEADGSLFGGDRDISVRPGTRIAGLPKHTLKLNLDWRADPKLTVGVTVIATSSLATQGNEDGLIGVTGNTTAVDASVRGYTLLNLHANYEMEKGFDTFARINNVFDRRFESYGMMAQSVFNASGSPQDATSINRFVAPGAPRSIMVGMRYRF